MDTGPLLLTLLGVILSPYAITAVVVALAVRRRRAAAEEGKD